MVMCISVSGSAVPQLRAGEKSQVSGRDVCFVTQQQMACFFVVFCFLCFLRFLSFFCSSLFF